MIKIGSKAPSFSLPSNDGNTYSLEALAGKKFVLYFYPKDDTPGCTVEAQEFNELAAEFKKKDALVFGVSPDTVAKHEKFAAKYNLTFPLLSDEGHIIAEKYGVWGKKKFMGREYDGVFRTTFLIDETGKIEKIWESVSPKGHAAEVCDVIVY